MMPLAGNLETPHQIETVDYKKKYKTLKRKLKFLVYEHECFLEELRKAQRKLLKVTRDRSFLLDRLIQYERTDDSSSDSDVTFSSDSETEAQRDGSAGKKKKTDAPISMFGSSVLLSNLGYRSVISGQPPGPQSSAFPGAGGDAHVSGTVRGSGGDAVRNFPIGVSAKLSAQQLGMMWSTGLHPQSTGSKTSEPAKKRAKVSKKAAQMGSGQQGSGSTIAMHKGTESQPSQPQQQQPGHMTREELERHLEFKQSTRPQFMSIDKMPNTLPDDIFSNENSNPDSDFGMDRMIKQEVQDDSDLVIDVPQD